MKLSSTCDTSSFAIYGADRTVVDTDLRHIRVAYSLDESTWTCYSQSDDASQGGTPSFAIASDNCDEGLSHAASGSVFNIAARAQYVSFAFWGWTDVYEVELASCNGGGGSGGVQMCDGSNITPVADQLSYLDASSARLTSADTMLPPTRTTTARLWRPSTRAMLQPVHYAGCSLPAYSIQLYCRMDFNLVTLQYLYLQ